jgi:hypothetical protein
MLQGPLSRFGDTASNTGILTLLNNLESTKDINVGFKTVAASASAAMFRIVLMPIDTVKVSYIISYEYDMIHAVYYTYYMDMGVHDG